MTVFFCFLLPCSGQALIKGHVHDSTRSKIMIYEPINGFYNSNIASSNSEIFPDSSGYFERAFLLNGPEFVRILKGTQSIDLFLESSDTIEVNVVEDNFGSRSEKKNNPFIVIGKNAKGIELYNSFYPIGRKIDEFKSVLDSMHYKDKYAPDIIDYALKKITSPFVSLFNENNISKDFYRIATNDIKEVLLSSEVEYLFIYQNKLDLSKQLKIVDELYSKYPVSNEMLTKGVNAANISDYYFYSKARRFYPTYYLADSTMFVNGRKIVIEQNLVLWLYAPDVIQEVAWPMNLINMKRIFPTEFRSRDVDALLTLHPNSPMRNYLKPPYFANDRKLEKNLTGSKIRFIDSNRYMQLSSLIISEFKGQRVFVDLWGTWCIPCKQEFTWNFQVDSFCNNNNIQRLYIAFELESTKSRVRDNVYKNGLAGFHIVANKFLIKDITEKIYKNSEGNYTIPRFLLINENGEIVNADASRPSSGNQLFSEMKSAFKLEN